MKRILAFLLAMCMIMTLVPFTANAATEYTEGYYIFTIADGEAKIIGAFYSLSGDATLPSKLGGYPVTKIGDYAFEGLFGLTSIKIPDSVTSIGEYAFWGCNYLTSVEISDSVTSIGRCAFMSCGSLASVTIGDGVKSIGDYAFAWCNNLVDIEIPDSVTFIDNDAFSDTAYYNDETNWKNGVLYIGNHLIKTLETLNGDYKIKAGTKTIAGSAFYECDGLTGICIPDSVKSIGDYAFAFCCNLADVEFPNSVISIGYRAFYLCDSLIVVNIPDSVASISEAAFSNCELERITVAENNSIYHIEENCLIETATMRLIASCKNSIISNGVTSIGEGAFDGCGKLEIDIPDSVKSIGDWAFANCYKLTSIEIPDSVTFIGEDAFTNCDSLTDVWYTGTVNDRNNIAIGDYNTCLTDATWHYETCNDEHTYLSDDDETCENCEWIRKIYISGDVDGEEGITANDAIYLLYNVFFGEQNYPVDQPCDFDGDGSVSANDAIYLLYHVFFGEETYPLN